MYDTFTRPPGAVYQPNVTVVPTSPVTDQIPQSLFGPPMPRPNPLRNPMLPTGPAAPLMQPVPQPGPAGGGQSRVMTPGANSALAAALVRSAQHGGPIETPIEGFGRLAQQFVGARMARQAEEQARQQELADAAAARQQQLEDENRRRQWGIEDEQRGVENKKDLIKWQTRRGRRSARRNAKPELTTIKQAGKDVSVWKNPDGTLTTATVEGAEGAPPPFSSDYKDYNSYTDDLRAEPSVNKYRESLDIYSSMTKSFSSESTASDLDFVYGFAKIMDPGSVVREGEYATVANSPAIPEQIRGRLQYVIEGKAKLTPKVKREMLEITGNRLNSYRENADKIVERYRTNAQNFGLDPDLVAPEGFLGETPTVPADNNATTSGTTSNGLNWSLEP